MIVFSASNHSASINAKLARCAAERLKAQMRPDTETTYLDLSDFEMPIYSLDREKADGVYPLAHDFFAKIGAADAVIVFYPEHKVLRARLGIISMTE